MESYNALCSLGKCVAEHIFFNALLFELIIFLRVIHQHHNVLHLFFYVVLIFLLQGLVRFLNGFQIDCYTLLCGFLIGNQVYRKRLLLLLLLYKAHFTLFYNT